MSIGRLAALIVLAIILCSGLGLLSVPASAEKPWDTIKGFVVDENGNPVPDANVSLWQNGSLVPCSMGNPQQSRFYDLLSTYPSSREYVGMFWLGLIYPGEYTIRAEKRGHVGTTTTSVTVVDTHYAFEANVTLSGYHLPVLTPEQLNLTGGVTGTIRGTDGTRIYGVNVTLWQNGEVVEMPGNPQLAETRLVAGQEVDYLFDHIAAGQYQVVALYDAPTRERENVTVNVTDGLAKADIVLSHLLLQSSHLIGTPSPCPLRRRHQVLIRCLFCHRSASPSCLSSRSTGPVKPSRASGQPPVHSPDSLTAMNATTNMSSVR